MIVDGNARVHLEIKKSKTLDRKLRLGGGGGGVAVGKGEFEG